MCGKLPSTFILIIFAAAFAAPLCPNRAEPFEGIGRGATESKARENANQDIANRFSTIKVNILDELTQKETGNDIKEYANYQRKIKVESELDAKYVKDAEYPYQKENGQFVAKRYLCPSDAARPYLDSLKIINQHVSIQKLSNSFCEDLYKTYSPRVMLFERILGRLGEGYQDKIANYRKAEKECDDMSASIKKGYVGFEEALDKVVAEVLSKRGKAKTKIVIAQIRAPSGKLSDFITAELESRLVSVKNFSVEPVNANAAISSMKIAEAMEIGKISKANIVILGSFDPYADFSQFTFRAIDAQSQKIFATNTGKIRHEAMLAGLLPNKLADITEEALAHLDKGKDLFAKNKLDEAIHEFSLALDINGNLTDAYYFRGNIYADKGNYDKAIEDYTTTLRIEPEDAYALYNRGCTYHDKGDLDKAIEDYTAAIRIDPDSPPEYFANRGIAYSDKENYDRAIEDFNAALKIKPDDYLALNSRGITYDKKGLNDRAIEDFNAALKIKPDYHSAIYNRGIAYSNKGNYNKAIEDWKTTLRMDPNNLDAKKNIEMARQEKAAAAMPAAVSFKDSRDNKTYKTAKIGNQTWMAENLNYNASGSKCFKNTNANCDKYGKMYNWAMAKTACPSGWHLPSKAEWEVLTAAVGGEKTEGKLLKAINGWENCNASANSNPCLDSHGFSALPGGYGDLEGNFYAVGYRGNWWSASENGANAYARRMGYSNEQAYWDNESKERFFSVRCLKN